MRYQNGKHFQQEETQSHSGDGAGQGGSGELLSF